MTKNIKQAFLQLWTEAPSLLLAIAFCLGCLFALKISWGLFLFPLLLLSTKSRSIPILTLLFLSPLALVTVPLETVSGEGTFIVQSISRSKSHFKQGFCHRGFWSFKDRTKGQHLPCLVFAEKKLSSFSAQGTLTPDLHLKVGERTEIKRRSLLPYRLAAKEWVIKTIHKKIGRKEAATFLAAIFTGEMEDKLMQHDFSMLGLSHLLAISGLHFALIALFVSALLFWLPTKARSLLLILVLTLYFLFLGNTPSVQRAYLFCMVQLTGKVIERRQNSLNTLGVALFLTALINPFSLKTLSLQLTFLATLGILLFNKKKKTAISVLKELSTLERILFVIKTLVSRSLRLTSAVHLMILPLLLTRFHYFYPHSIVYNLLFPFLMSLSLLLLLISFVLPFLHPFNSLYTSWLLQLVENPPLKLPGLFFEEVSPLLMLILTLSLAIYAVYGRAKLPGSSFSLTEVIPIRLRS